MKKYIYTVCVEKWTEYNDKIKTLLSGEFDDEQSSNLAFNWAKEYFVSLIQSRIENADYHVLYDALIVKQNNDIIKLRYYNNNVNGSILYNTNEIYIRKLLDWT